MVIGLLMKTPPGPATSKKWQALGAGTVLVILVITGITTAFTASKLPIQYEFSPPETALLEVIFAEQFGPLEGADKVINCQYPSVRIMLAKSTPADVADVIGRYSKAERSCDGRYSYLAEVRRHCSDKNSRWGQRCAADLPRAQLAEIAAGPELDATRDNENLNRKITELLDIMEKAQSGR